MKKPGRPRNKKGTIRKQIEFHPELLRRTESEAERLRIPFSGYIRYAVLAELARTESK